MSVLSASLAGLRTWQTEFDAACAAWEKSQDNAILARIVFPGGQAQAECQQALAAVCHIS